MSVWFKNKIEGKYSVNFGLKHLNFVSKTFFSLILYIWIPEYAKSPLSFILIIPIKWYSDCKSISLTLWAFFFWYSRISSKFEKSVFLSLNLMHSEHT